MQVAVSRHDAGSSGPTSERLGEMAIAIEPVEPEARCGMVYERFRRDLERPRCSPISVRSGTSSSISSATPSSSRLQADA